MSSSSSFHPSLLLSLHLFIHSLWSFIIVSVLSSSVCCSSYMMSTSCRPLLVLFIGLEKRHTKKINNLANGSFNSRRSRGGSEITKFRPCDQDDGALDRLRRDKTQTSGAVTLICLSVWVCLCDCVDLHQVEAAELQTSLSVKIKVKNTSTIKTGCSYLMSWKPWEPSLGGFVVVRQFQWQVLVPT